MKGTILEAVQSALAESGKPMDVRDIELRITEKNLYAFKAKDPVGVIRKVLRRHSTNAATKDASSLRCFEARSDGKYELAYPKRG